MVLVTEEPIEGGSVYQRELTNLLDGKLIEPLLIDECDKGVLDLESCASRTKIGRICCHSFAPVAARDTNG